MCPAGSSRWCPTPEQLMILEEMYRGGIRTPNASQIQHITAHLSFYGKIEGKNVFYWFQNHKARDRQKLRRKLNKLQQQQQQQQQLYYHLQVNQSYNDHHHFLCDMESASASSTPHPSLHNSVASSFSDINTQGGAGEASSSSKHGINETWNMDNGDGKGEKTLRTKYKEDWRMMMDGGEVEASYCPRPLKTLELFPIRDRLKQECSTSKPVLSEPDISN